MIYIAGPFFNIEEMDIITGVEKILEDRGLEFYCPRLHDDLEHEYMSPEWSRATFELDRDAIDRCSLVLAVYHGNYSDTGTAWECGYAYAIGKPVILVHVDAANDSSLMLHSSCTTNILLSDLADYDFETLPEYEYEGAMK